MQKSITFVLIFVKLILNFIFHIFRINKSNKMVDIQLKKNRYRKLCDEKQDIPLFMQAWWMDAICIKQNWDVLFYKKNDKIIAVLVYYIVEKYGFKLIIQPQLTQSNGIWIEYPDNQSSYEIISFEKEIMSNLIEQLNKLRFSYYDQNFQPKITNWLPFFWKGFSQTTRYTYQIKDISDVEKCYQQFSYAKKKQISKAKKNLKTDLILSGELFYKELQQNFKEINQNVFYSKDLFLKLYNECMSRNQGCIITARDNQQNIHAANFIVWDNNCAYNLISTIKKEFRSSGASSLIIWEAIKLMSSKTEKFDFEGSMHESIENSFRQFGTVQIQYFRIKKYNSLSLRLFINLKKWF